MGLLRSATLPGQRLALGFTLIELSVVVAVLAIVASVAAPGLGAFVSGQRVKALTHDLGSDLQFARSEALKRGAVVDVTPRSGNWAAGWVVASGGIDILSREAVAEALQVSDAPSAISFNVHGRVAVPTSAVRITVRSSVAAGGLAARCVELDLSGRSSTKIGVCT